MQEGVDEAGRTGDLIQTGSELAGAAVGAALGLFGGPPGAVGGAVGGVLLTRTLKRVGIEIQERLMGHRQHVRIGAAFAFAAAEIEARLARGERPREDGWFEASGFGRAASEEVLEGVLLNAGDTYEEQKVKHLGWLYASLAFETGIDRAYANHLLRLADRLSYHELVTMALFGSEGHRRQEALEAVDTARQAGTATSSEAILAELNEVGQFGLLGFRQEDGRVTPPLGTWGGGSPSAWKLAQLFLTPLGKDIYRLTNLNQISEEEKQVVLRALGAAAT